jgi:NADH-quinone oxidoreductase subunit D
MTLKQELIKTQQMEINFGPHHPSTHGVYRAVFTLDGEYITKCVNHLGYLHRGIEKLAESRTYTQFIPYNGRLDYVSAMLNETCYVQAVEELMGITDQIPERAHYIRVIMCELQRIASHLVFGPPWRWIWQALLPGPMVSGKGMSFSISLKWRQATA